VPRELARALDVRVGLERPMAGVGILGRLELDHHAGEALRQRVVDVARHPVALVEHRAAAALLLEPGELQRKRCLQR
jgi:hypothetical protein